MISARAQRYLQVTLIELLLGYAIAGLVLIAGDFIQRMMPDEHGPVLDELFFVDDAFEEVLLSRMVLVHISLYLAAKCLHMLLEGRGRTTTVVIFAIGAIAAPCLWNTPIAHGDAMGGAVLVGFFLLGLPFLVLIISHLTFLPRMVETVED